MSQTPRGLSLSIFRKPLQRVQTSSTTHQLAVHFVSQRAGPPRKRLATRSRPAPSISKIQLADRARTWNRPFGDPPLCHRVTSRWLPGNTCITLMRLSMRHQQTHNICYACGDVYRKCNQLDAVADYPNPDRLSSFPDGTQPGNLQTGDRPANVTVRPLSPIGNCQPSGGGPRLSRLRLGPLLLAWHRRPHSAVQGADPESAVMVGREGLMKVREHVSGCLSFSRSLESSYKSSTAVEDDANLKVKVGMQPFYHRCRQASGSRTRAVKIAAGRSGQVLRLLAGYLKLGPVPHGNPLGQSLSEMRMKTAWITIQKSARDTYG